MLSAHAGALLLIIGLPMAAWPKIGLAALVGASQWWEGRFGAGTSVGEINVEDDGSCIRTTQSGQCVYRIARASVHAGFMRLTLQRPGERTRTQLIARDAVEPEIYRTLRARIVQRRLPVSDRG